MKKLFILITFLLSLSSFADNVNESADLEQLTKSYSDNTELEVIMFSPKWLCGPCYGASTVTESSEDVERNVMTVKSEEFNSEVSFQTVVLSETVASAYGIDHFPLVLFVANGKYLSHHTKAMVPFETGKELDRITNSDKYYDMIRSYYGHND